MRSPTSTSSGSSSAVTPVETRTSFEHDRIASVDPFVKDTNPPAGSRCTVVMHLRSESNGSSATRGNRDCCGAFSTPAPCAADMRATSVGSPRTVPVGPVTRIVAERHRQKQLGPGAASARTLPSLAIAVQLLDPHAVHCQRAGLVRADVGDGAERLHSGQPPHQRVPRDHLAGAERERDRDHRRQGLGDRRHGEAHGDQEDGEWRLTASQPRREDDDTDAEDREGQMLPETRQAPLKGSLDLLGSLKRCSDPAELRVHAGGDDHAPAPAIGGDGALVRHVRAGRRPGARRRRARPSSFRPGRTRR